MSYTAIIAAGGVSRRTGLGEYTTKAALPLEGRSLLAHQLAFARRSGCDRALVVCRPEHARLLGRLLALEDWHYAAFVFSDQPTGWAGEIERCHVHIEDDDEVLLLSCDNLHSRQAERLVVDHDWRFDALFTWTTWGRIDREPAALVLARGPTVWGPGEDAWVVRDGEGFTGDFFSGYAACRGALLFAALREVRPDEVGRKELPALLSVLAQHPRCRAVPYGGVYEDVADLRDLARIAARLRQDGSERGEVEIGAGVLLYDREKRVLLTERADGRGWCPPGGIVDRGERYAHAALRELQEEVGIGVEEGALRLLGIYPSASKAGGPAATVIFHARYEVFIGSGMREVNNAEVRDARWFGPETARGLTIPFGLRQAIEDYFAGRELDCR